MTVSYKKREKVIPERNGNSHALSVNAPAALPAACTIAAAAGSRSGGEAEADD
ncbi:MAG: hypothetical protein HY778_17365 [Betaproteobacteria bacterium]|nr:hypothetical protein [Betaproteobacteria bacterium]